jgi:hypothetical protein
MLPMAYDLEHFASKAGQSSGILRYPCHNLSHQLMIPDLNSSTIMEASWQQQKQQQPLLPTFARRGDIGWNRNPLKIAEYFHEGHGHS